MRRPVTISIDHELYDEFKKYCEQDGQKISHVVAALMRSYMAEDSGVTPSETTAFDRARTSDLNYRR